ncbi:phage tail protein [Pseudomonas aeruginosa]|uniref:phage tail protein n=1 Tax=Pseudomonas aeruginosa TaxID=287 RepID=UPI001EFA2325|nr:phage tail protein [Pseudomonas aeruginosa]
MGLLQFLVIGAVDEVGNSLLRLTVLLDERPEHAEHLRSLTGIAADQTYRYAQRRQDVAQGLDLQVSRQRGEDAGYEVRRHQVGVLGSVVKPAEHAVGVDLQQFVQYQYLEDDDQRQLPTFRNAQSFSMPIADDPNLPQWAVIEAADQSKALQVIRLTLRNGSEVFYNGYVSVSDTPTLNVNEIMTRTLTIALDGRPVRYNPAP